MKIKCHAKINLSLNVYENINSLHKIESLVQTLKLHDVLKVKFYKNILNIDNININHIKDVPYDKNLIIKAIKEFSKYKILNNLSINLLKNIPSKAGLGGASSDAFGILKILNTKYRNTLNNKTLIEISSKIGLDVPLFFSGGTTLIENFGDKVIKLKDLPKFYVILIKPNFSVSTKEAYENIDKIYSDKEFFENNKKIGQINHKKIIKNIKDITKYKKQTKI